MNWISAFIVMGVCFWVFMATCWIWKLNQARRKGLYPPQGKATMFDVRRLLLLGEKDLAVHLYSEIFKTDFNNSRKAVEELERSIQEKNLEA